MVSQSPSSRRAWIEICQGVGSWAASFVALLAEGVDRNAAVIAVNPEIDMSPSSRRAWIEIRLWEPTPPPSSSPSSRRAWIEIDLVCSPDVADTSPSSRRAWIEICVCRFVSLHSCVALLAEGVDRNLKPLLRGQRKTGSPSSRRAWIEIRLRRSPAGCNPVALLAEGVDRNRSARV